MEDKPNDRGERYGKRRLPPARSAEVDDSDAEIRERSVGIGVAMGSAFGLAVGAGVGVALGALTWGIGLGLCIGAGIGIALGAAMGNRRAADPPQR